MVAKRRSQPARKTSPKSASTPRPSAQKVAKRPVKAAPKAKALKGKPAAAKAPVKPVKQPSAPKAKPGAASKPSKPAPVSAAPSAPRNLRSQISDLTFPHSAPVAKPAAPAAKSAAVASAPAPAAKPAPVSRPSAPAAARPSAPTASPAQTSAAAVAAPVPAAPAPRPPVPPPPVRRPLVTLTLVTRKSPLAVVQSELVLARFAERIPNYAFRVFKLVTTGDRQAEWSLEQEGGKGLFTGELEQALTDHRADLAVHSAKDLPTEMPAGLALAGFLPREDPRDMLVVREDVTRPLTIATGSPRRRLQLERQFQKASFLEIRGNVETRLRKIAEERVADATVLAAAGLKRLGITEWPGLRFQPLPLAVSVPAVGQAAIAVQARVETANFLRPHLDEATRVAVELERAFLRLMGGGCHTAFAVHYDGTGVHLFHENCGYQRFTIALSEALEPTRVAERILTQLKLRL